MKTGDIFVVATPIGNLKDITLRALEVLKTVDFIVAEDTRVTRKILAHYDIKKPTLSLHKNSPEGAYLKVEECLANGKNIALVSDAGTPGISDPGPALLRRSRDKFPKIKIIPLPGPSALTAALSVSGENADRFTFLGYPPRKKGRKTFFEELASTKTSPIVIYEAPHRLEKTLNELQSALGEDGQIAIMKEMTKIYETIWRGSIAEARSVFMGEKQKGEFVIILSMRTSRHKTEQERQKTPRACARGFNAQ